MAKQSTALSLRCYIWLADTIIAAGRISREDINRKWARSSFNIEGTTEIPERTFHHWKHEIEDLFDISIECDRRTNKYYIDNADDEYWNRQRRWLINTFAVNNMLAENRQIKDRILLENIPQGQDQLTCIIEAICNLKQIRITYRSFVSDHSSSFRVSPWCLKVFRQRWYMMGSSEGYEQPRIYAIDRISYVEPTDEPYEIPDDFDAEACFRDVIGVSGLNGKCEQIRIRVWGTQVFYLRTLPLHESQTEIETGDNYAVFEYRLIPNYEFYQELFRHLSYVEVISPAAVREAVKREAVALLAQYNWSTEQNTTICRTL